MQESSITHFGNGGVTLAGPDAVRVFAAATLSSALGLKAKGISPTRGFTLKRGLAIPASALHFRLIHFRPRPSRPTTA